MRSKFFILILLLLPFIGKGNTLTVINTHNAGYGSLRGIIDSASNGDTINFNPNLISSGSDSIVLLSEISITKGLTIKGLYNSTDTLFISGGNSNRIFNINLISATFKKMILDSMCIVNGYSNNHGGGIYFSRGDSLLIYNTLIRNNKCSTTSNVNLFGGGIYTITPVIIKNSSLIGNSVFSKSSSYGGGLYSDSTITVSNSLIYNNKVMTDLFGKGGGIFSNSAINIIDCEISNNSSIGSSYSHDIEGGGVFSNSSITINKCIFFKNSAESSPGGNGVYGGAIYCKSSLIVDSSEFILNKSFISSTSSGMYGGAIWAFGDLTLRNCLFDSNGNQSDTDISIFSLNNLNCLIENTIIKNSSGGLGVYCNDTLIINIVNSQILNCKLGGGIRLSADSLLLADIINSSINNNSAYNGGGIYLRSATKAYINIKSCDIIGNTASKSGGGLNAFSNNDSLILTIDRCNIINNSAKDWGGGVLASSNLHNLITLNSSILSNNVLVSGSSTVKRGAGMYCIAYGFKSFNKINIYNSSIYNNDNTNGYESLGGGIHAYSSGASVVDVEYSTFFNNKTASARTAKGSAIYNYSVDSSIVNIKSSTVFNNENFILPTSVSSYNGYGAIYNIASTGNDKVNFSSNIFFGNIYNRKNISIEKSHFNFNTTASSNGYNIFDNGQTGTTSQDYLNITSSQLKLDTTIKFNGGTTPTLLPGVGSLALNLGNPSDLSDAQNGMLVGRRDIGAAERNLNVFSYDSITACDSLTWIDSKTYYSDTIISKTYIAGASNGFDSIITLTLKVIRCFPGLKELNPSLEMLIYPNPANEVLNISLSNLNQDNLTVQMYNSAGKMILSKPLKNSLLQIDVSSIDKGIYFIKVSNQQINLSKKVLVLSY